MRADAGGSATVAGRRRRIGGLALLLLGLPAVLATSALGQTRTVSEPNVVFDDAQIFHPATDPSRFVSVYDTRNLDPKQFTLGLYATYAHDPIDLTFEAADRKSSDVIRDTIGADLIAAFGVTQRIQLGLDVPAVHNSAERVLSFGQVIDGGGFSAGDVALESKFTLIPRPVGQGFGLSLLPRLLLPTGDRERFAGTGKLGGGGLVIADWRYHKINYGVNVGGILRNSDEADDQVQAGGAVTVPAARFLDVIGELTGRSSLRGERSTPIEGLLSLRFHHGSIALTIGGGGGITSGRGAPAFRFIAGISPYIPEKEIPPPRADLVTNSRKSWRLAVDVDNDGRPNPGDTLEYTINVVNTGTAPAQDVVLHDPVPEHASYVPGSMALNGAPLSDPTDGDAGDYDVTERGAVTVKVGAIGNEAGKNSVTFSFRVVVDPNLVDLTVIRNQAVVDQTNPAAAEETEPNAAPRLEDRLPVAETTIFPKVRERETVVVTPEKLELTRNIHFEFNRATIRPESYSILNDVAGVLQDNPRLNILIEGHTDAVGSVEYNQKLSERRADAVRTYLVARGVAATRLGTKGRGKLAPIASNETAVGRALNRRVEFLIVNPEALQGRNVEHKPFVEDITPQSEPPDVEQRLPGARRGGDRDTIEAQQALRKIHYLSEPANGILSPATRSALEQFQKDNGLPVTGVPDAITRKALDEAVELQRSQ